MIELQKQRSQCALASGLELLGDRWTLLIVRDLMMTDRREFNHFLNSGEGISTNILSERLERLQDAGLVTKKPHPGHGKKFIYELTQRGLNLAPVVIEFTLWSLDNIEHTYIPPQIDKMMHQHKPELIEKIMKREVLVSCCSGDESTGKDTD